MKYEYLDEKKKYVKYVKEMGEYLLDETFKGLFTKMPFEEQINMGLLHFKSHYDYSTDSDKLYNMQYKSIAGYIFDNSVFVGVLMTIKSATKPLLMNSNLYLYDEEGSDNNGAGYKESHEYAYFSLSLKAITEDGAVLIESHTDEIDKGLGIDFTNVKELHIGESVEHISIEIPCDVYYHGWPTKFIRKWFGLKIKGNIHFVDDNGLIIKQIVMNNYDGESFRNLVDIESITFEEPEQEYIYLNSFLGCISLRRIVLSHFFNHVAAYDIDIKKEFPHLELIEDEAGYYLLNDYNEPHALVMLKDKEVCSINPKTSTMDINVSKNVKRIDIYKEMRYVSLRNEDSLDVYYHGNENDFKRVNFWSKNPVQLFLVGENGNATLIER